MIGLMTLLREVFSDEQYGFVNKTLRGRAQKGVQTGDRVYLGLSDNSEWEADSLVRST